ncbi:hypothetical protein CYMTET_18188 [Cymbomonas tetramitiformis]|uniref:Uncharacterized protein n=1 Tax=Cymbomonas tetramitiformis TaxID=36881 RepID=A0AAE0G8M5_9CHLO|nr:hypothetical protein CYMTET_18188 [Cymbomonas tetramitiformis]
MVCLGGKDFIGLANLMALGSHSAADVDGRHAGLVNLTMWAQEVVLCTFEESVANLESASVKMGAPDQAAFAAGSQEPDPSAPEAALSAEQSSSNNDSWADGHGLQVLAEELEFVVHEGMAMLASSAERLTAAVAEAVSEQVRVVLVSGARDAAARGKSQAVAALATCDTVLGGVEETLRGVGAAAVACKPMLQLTSKLLRALSTSPGDAIVEEAIGRALHELDPVVCGIEDRLRTRLTDALTEENLAEEPSAALAESQSSGYASTSVPLPATPSDTVDGASLRDAVKASLTRRLSEVVLAELRPLLGTLQAFLGLPKGPASQGARRELMKLAIELDGEVARMAQEDVDRCMKNEEDVAPRGQREAETLVKELLERFPGAVSKWVAAALERIRKEMRLLASDSSKASSPPVRVAPLMDAIAHVDASMATLEQKAVSS